ncbi:transporter, NhaC family [Desulfonispora thiosulfatigenes DSM 11270]|uniref:Transporter, NhaC family n=1 Tax=Desulfonispora thiosulfatigenes DSM 11270 TaxID=656914 RepID=A0A1W1VPA6_DESTI|nr:Na+/H+ antiporter NhaC [Desulfonispora thiosulfatigenes]SMB95156.1 transporter, NhaC family [Desulfonispora thiosulfatigenes DSM 11270]
MTDANKNIKQISFLKALIPIVFLIVALISTLKFFDGDPHMAIFASTIVAGLVAKSAGHSWKSLEQGIVDTFSKTTQSILIFCIIGIVISTWILAGIVPAMIFYGLKIIAPSIFLITSCLICAIVALATGSSWTTVGTVGIAIIGMGQGFDIPLPIVAGSIISGAYFGDKLSPLSDTTNLASAMAEVNLFDHIKHLLYTSIPSLMIALTIYGVLGIKYGNASLDTGSIDLLLTNLSSQFYISPVLLIPPVLIIAIVIMRIPAIPGLVGGVILGSLFAFVFQGSDMTTIIRVAHYGYVSNTGIESVDSLLTNGGLNGMMWALSLVFASLSFAGIMETSGMINAIAEKILVYAKRTGSLILATVLTCFSINIMTGDQYLSIIFTGKMYKKSYTLKGLHTKNLSRTLEDAGTLSSPLVPWNACAVFMATTLGVSTMAYLPFVFFNLFSPIIAVIFGYLNIAIEQKDQDI